ncbi:hypothetical protein PRNP1_000970 [Phytophthora ramorum]
MVAHCIFSSSRRNGVRGISFDDGVSALSGRTIPFLAPANAEWPQCMLDTNNVNDCKFGHLIRACNEERCEVLVQDVTSRNEDGVFLCVCKYWKEQVNTNTMRAIIAGLNTTWAEWEVVLVFCKEVADVGAELKNDNIGCVKIDFRDGSVD